MRNRFVLALDQVREPSKIGNKAFNLRFLSQRAFATPVTFVCTTDAFARYLHGDPHITRMVRDELSRSIDPRRRYAVRSSASLEDSLDYSCAGQFKTELNVQGIDAIMQAVQTVWDSSQSPSAHTYLEKMARDLHDLKMSVIVQEMVSPVVSGVAFSRNPITGLDEVIVEAVPGSGEALVQDGITPERWVHKWGQWVQRPSQGQIGMQVVEQVVDQTRTIARTYGKPVDLEWVYDGQRVHWVQLRQITSLQGVSLYSNRIAKEMMPGIIKPLVWSIQVPIHAGLWARVFEEIVGPNRVRVEDLVKPFYYQAYFNMGVIGDILETMGMPRDGFEVMMGIEAPREHRPSFKPTSTTWRLMPRMLGFVWSKWRYGNTLPQTIAALQEKWQGVSANEVHTLNERELVASIERLISMVEEVELCNLLTQVLMMAHHGMLQGQLRKLGLDLEAIASVDPEQALAPHDVNGHLAALHARFTSLDSGLQGRIQNTTFAELASIEGAETFARELAHFMDDFGHLSDSSNDFSAISWRESPDELLKMVIAYPDPKFTQASRCCLDEIKLSRMKRAYLKSFCTRTLAFKRHREEVGFLFTYGMGIMRCHFLALGDRLSRRGALDTPEDIFYLSWDEVRTLTTNDTLPSSPAELIGSRKHEMEAARTVTPPSIIYGDKPAPLEILSGDRMTGTPTSRGYYRGVVKVARGLQDANKINEGDVLVIPYSDIGWTPLFAHAGAVVAESGGMLSHSSIVAREYNIPAVVSVAGACTLADGTVVTVDGYKGEIIVHREA
jgi:phosphohistidine swiveling domain-containing protein